MEIYYPKIKLINNAYSRAIVHTVVIPAILFIAVFLIDTHKSLLVSLSYIAVIAILQVILKHKENNKERDFRVSVFFHILKVIVLCLLAVATMLLLIILLNPQFVGV